MHQQYTARRATLAVVAFVTLNAVGAMGNAQAESLTEFKGSASRGFSYFLGIAQQSATYSEKPSLMAVSTSSKTKSAMLVSGALYAFNDDVLLSLDNLSTFAPATSLERWHYTDGGALLQTNRFSLSQSNTRAMGYLRSHKDTFFVGGLNLRSQSFKRYDFQITDANAAISDPVPTEETSSEVVAEIGLAIDSERVKESENHYGMRLTLGTPLWRQLTNTQYAGLNFDSRQGWGANLEGRYSWAIAKYAHLGLWGKYSFSHRGAQRIGYIQLDNNTQIYTRRTAEIPSANLRTTTIGIELLWKL
jgi:hypothetical protein